MARERHDRLLEPDIRDIRTAVLLGTTRLEAHRQAVRRGNVAAVWLATRRSLAAIAEVWSMSLGIYKQRTPHNPPSRPNLPNCRLQC